MAEDVVLDMNPGGGAFVQKTTDPLILPQPYTQPTDFAAQYPDPLDTTEILRLCEDISVWNSLPEERTQLSTYTWREMTSLAYTSGSAYIAFADGACPEAYDHDGSNSHVHIKNLGVKKTLSVRDIMHSQAVAGMGQGINALVGPAASNQGFPGTNGNTFARESVANVKEKEIRLGATLMMNGWDRLLVLGDTNTNSLEFDGIEQWATNQSCTQHTNSNTASGTFSAISFDRFLAEGCAMPTRLYGHPATMQEVMAAYFALGFNGSQVVNVSSGDRITPGYNFSSFVNTGVGRLEVVSDRNFTRTNAGSVFQADVWALRMVHNGEPLVYKVTQIPLSLTDLAPGCTAVSFEIWCATSFVMKMCCAQSKYTTQLTGRIATTCTTVG
jgi:hypothetical protein